MCTRGLIAVLFFYAVYIVTVLIIMSVYFRDSTKFEREDQRSDEVNAAYEI